MAGLYKRGKTWWGRAQRQGREYRRSLKTADKAVAWRRLRQWTGELDKIAWGDKPARTFNEAAEKFAKEHATTLRPSSARRYRTSLMHLIDHFNGKYLHDVTSAMLMEFEGKRRTDGAAAPTIRRDLACLSSVMGSALDWEWIDVNPIPAYMRRRRRRGLKESPPRTRYLTQQEELKLLSGATPEPARAIKFAIDSGLRREEQFSLTWAQIDFARGRILLGKNTKSGIPREVPFIGRVGTILGTMPRHIRSPYVFWHDNGRRYNNMEKGLKSAAKRAGIKDLRWHDLRRTFGCRRIQVDRLSMEQIRELLGHHSVSVTEKSYAFLSIDQIQADLTKTGTSEADRG